MPSPNQYRRKAGLSTPSIIKDNAAIIAPVAGAILAPYLLGGGVVGGLGTPQAVAGIPSGTLASGVGAGVGAAVGQAMAPILPTPEVDVPPPLIASERRKRGRSGAQAGRAGTLLGGVLGGQDAGSGGQKTLLGY